MEELSEPSASAWATKEGTVPPPHERRSIERVPETGAASQQEEWPKAVTAPAEPTVADTPPVAPLPGWHEPTTCPTPSQPQPRGRPAKRPMTPATPAAAPADATPEVGAWRAWARGKRESAGAALKSAGARAAAAAASARAAVEASPAEGRWSLGSGAEGRSRSSSVSSDGGGKWARARTHWDVLHALQRQEKEIGARPSALQARIA